MKIRNLLAIVAMFSLLIFGIGTAHAVYGVNDDVAGTDVVIPIICEKGGTMNTLWAVGDVDGSENYTDGSGHAHIMADLLVFDKRSVERYDEEVEWTLVDNDVVVDDCQSVIARMGDAQKELLEATIGGKTYYIGYLVYYNWVSDNDRFVPWVYLVDLPKGFASGFNGYAAEGYINLDDLSEYDYDVTAYELYPRYYIHNNLADTWNWWIILKGENGSSAFDPGQKHVLEGVLCNEDEVCSSLSIDIPDELNIIDVAPYVPAALGLTYPKAGFAMLDTDTVEGQADPAVATFDTFTTLGWSYERASASSIAASWDVIHPMHRDGYDQATP